MSIAPSTVSILITTYNWVKALELVLSSVLKQTRLPDEILIADDGSGRETKDLIDKFINDNKNLNIKHIWHEDLGFRVGPIRNKAIAKASSDYLIQIDGDTILEKHFVADHISKAKKKQFIIGSRALFEQSLTSSFSDKPNQKINLFTKGVSNKLNLLRLPFLSKLLENPTTDIEKIARSSHSCNMSSYLQDLKDINGYNEEMTGWGREDSELVVRLANNGLTKIKSKFMCIQYHLYHKENDRSRFDINDKILNEAIAEKKTWCEKGISQKS